MKRIEHPQPHKNPTRVVEHDNRGGMKSQNTLQSEKDMEKLPVQLGAKGGNEPLVVVDGKTEEHHTPSTEFGPSMHTGTKSE